MNNEKQKELKVMIKFNDFRFDNDKEVWIYIQGFLTAIGEDGIQWFGCEFADRLVVDGTIFTNISEWVHTQE